MKLSIFLNFTRSFLCDRFKFVKFYKEGREHTRTYCIYIRDDSVADREGMGDVGPDLLWPRILEALIHR